MGVFLAVVILVGAVLALLAAVSALRAYLRYRRARAVVRDHLIEEVNRLSRRTAELERSLSLLDARAQELPIRISEMQQSLATLRVLTEALAASLGQAQRVLSFSALKSLSSIHISEMLRQRESGRSPQPAESRREATPTEART
ncbi:MAG TPA: hypothetical protein VK869_03520 [Rubrobacteraceae bacterium]|nr:hypothetical protein [Rubrobacteraceae bacterium]